jgi:hypothetical protein
MIVYEEDVVSLEELRSVLSTYAGPDEPRERPARAFRAVARRRFRRGRNADRRGGCSLHRCGSRSRRCHRCVTGVEDRTGGHVITVLHVGRSSDCGGKHSKPLRAGA